MKKSIYLSGLLVGCFMLFTIAAQATLPTITANPSPDTACSGATAMFFIAANNTPDLSVINYSWQLSTDGGVTWSAITDVAPYSHSTTDTLNITASMALNGYMYRSIASDTSGNDTSLAGMLTVDTLNAGVITGAPAMCVGSLMILTDAVPGGVWSHINHIADTLTPATGHVTGLAQGFDTITYVVMNACGTAIATTSLRVDTTVTGLPISGPNTTCVGHTIDLMDANVLGTRTWSAVNTSASVTATGGTVMGLSHGVDTVVYTFTNGCNTVRDSIEIEVDTVLSAGGISGLTSVVCAGSWRHLSDAVTGGVWLSSSSNTIVDDLGNVTGVSEGTSTISYLVSNGCGPTVATYVVTVNVPAGAITGGDSVGIGATIVLSDGTPGGTWTIADTSIANFDSVGIAGIATGSTTVTYTVTNVCGTTSATMTLYAGHAPTADIITGPDSVCRGASITLTDTISGGVWLSSNTGVATIDNTGVATGVATGITTISYIVHNAFGVDTVTRVVEVDSLPIVMISGPSTIAVNQNIIFLGVPCCGTFTNSPDTVGSFVSFGIVGDTVVDSQRYTHASFGSYVVYGPGTDVITYTVANGCGSRHNTFTISLATASYVSNINGANESLQLYPNPNDGSFTMNLISRANEQVSVTITNIVGEKIKELMIPTNTSTDIKLDQPAGIYLLSAKTANGNYTAKITITK